MYINNSHFEILQLLNMISNFHLKLKLVLDIVVGESS